MSPTAPGESVTVSCKYILCAHSTSTCLHTRSPQMLVRRHQSSLALFLTTLRTLTWVSLYQLLRFLLHVRPISDRILAILSTSMTKTTKVTTTICMTRTICSSTMTRTPAPYLLAALSHLITAIAHCYCLDCSIHLNKSSSKPKKSSPKRIIILTLPPCAFPGIKHTSLCNGLFVNLLHPPCPQLYVFHIDNVCAKPREMII